MRRIRLRNSKLIDRSPHRLPVKSTSRIRGWGQSGRVHSAIPTVLALVALGWVLAYLWIPTRSPQTSSPQTGVTEVIQKNRSGSPATDSTGTTASEALSPLDSLSPQMRTIREQLDRLFLKTQWNQAMDASTAHRVARAREDLESYLDSLAEEHVPLLLGLLAEEPDFINRRFLLRALGKIGNDEALAGLLDHFNWAAGNSKESEVKHTVAALAAANNDRSFQILSDYAVAEETETHRYRFVGALTQHSRSADAIGIYSELLTDSSHFRVRQRAAFGMKISGGIAQAHEVETALVDEGNPYVRQSFLGALGGIRDVRSVPLVSRILQGDEVLATRVSAVRALLRIEGDAVVDALRAARDDISQPQRVHEEVLRALDSLGISG
ncbi:MAG: HEAT repeat domain-containing protein [Planctomycetota bacterium]|nr:HEAT repeat domain-containing protein [Planctomycetota bacterium]